MESQTQELRRTVSQLTTELKAFEAELAEAKAKATISQVHAQARDFASQSIGSKRQRPPSKPEAVSEGSVAKDGKKPKLMRARPMVETSQIAGKKKRVIESTGADKNKELSAKSPQNKKVKFAFVSS